jgi:hypothetical protein
LSKSLSSDISQDEIINFTKASHYFSQRMSAGDVQVDFTWYDYDGLVCEATKVDRSLRRDGRYDDKNNLHHVKSHRIFKSKI